MCARIGHAWGKRGAAVRGLKFPSTLPSRSSPHQPSASVAGFLRSDCWIFGTNIIVSVVKMRIVVPLSPWEGENVLATSGKRIPQSKGFQGFSPIPFQLQPTNAPVVKSPSKTPNAKRARTPLLDLNRNINESQTTPRLVLEPSSQSSTQKQPQECTQAATEESIEDAPLVFPYSDSPPAPRHQTTKLLHNHHTCQQAEETRTADTAPAILTFTINEALQPVTEPVFLTITIVEPPEQQKPILDTAALQRVDLLEAENQELVGEIAELHATNARLESEFAEVRNLVEERTAELAAAREQAASLRSSLTAAQASAKVSIGTPPAARVTIQQLREELARARRAEASLQTRCSSLEATLEHRANEHASLVDFLSMERDVLVQELTRVTDKVKSAERAAAEARAKAEEATVETASLLRDREAAACNVAKAESEVDLLAAEVESLSRQLNYVNSRLHASLPALAAAVPGVARLARELAAFCEKERHELPKGQTPTTSVENVEQLDTQGTSVEARRKPLAKGQPASFAPTALKKRETPTCAVHRPLPLPKSAFKARRRD